MFETFRKWTLTASAAVFAIAALLAAVHLFAPEARAQTPPPTATCEAFGPPLTEQKLAEKYSGWMNEQIGLGKRSFVHSSGRIVCAW